LNDEAYTNASAKIKRPSASLPISKNILHSLPVLSISMDFPLDANTTSDGLVAVPLGMFSVIVRNNSNKNTNL
jgi:hypothetical protein